MEPQGHGTQSHTVSGGGGRNPAPNRKIIRKPWPRVNSGRNASQPLPHSKVYPDDKVGQWLFALGALVLFLFAPTWIWIAGVGVALVSIGIHLITHE